MNRKYIITISVILFFTALFIIERRKALIDDFVYSYFKEPINYTLRASTINFQDVYKNVSFKNYATPEAIAKKYDFELYNRIYDFIFYPGSSPLDYLPWYYEACLFDAWLYMMDLGYPEDIKVSEIKGGESTVLARSPNGLDQDMTQGVTYKQVQSFSVHPDDIEQEVGVGQYVTIEVHPEIYEVLCVPEEAQLYRYVYKALRKESPNMGEEKLKKQVRDRVKKLKKRAFFNNINLLNEEYTNLEYKVVR